MPKMEFVLHPLDAPAAFKLAFDKVADKYPTIEKERFTYVGSTKDTHYFQVWGDVTEYTVPREPPMKVATNLGNEMCKCGHKRANHGTRFSLAVGHGECRMGPPEESCPCSQFTWAAGPLEGYKYDA